MIFFNQGMLLLGSNYFLIKKGVYGFEISALVPEKLKFEKYVKYAKLFKFLFL